MRAINNEEQLKELFKTGVRVGETVAIKVGSDLEGTIEVWGELTVMLGVWCKNITVKAYHHSKVGIMSDASINVIALNGSIVDARGNTKVEAYGNTKVKVGGNAIVEYEDIGEPTIEAYANAVVKALRGRAMIVAYGKTKIEAHGGTFVRAYGDSSIKAYDQVIVDANDNAIVEAYDEAIVRARWEVSVKAHNKVVVKSSNCREIVLEDFSTAIVGEHEDFGRPDVVVASENARVIEY